MEGPKFCLSQETEDGRNLYDIPTHEVSVEISAKFVNHKNLIQSNHHLLLSQCR